MTTVEKIKNYIFLVRGQRVMFDNHLSVLYEVPTKYLNLQVRRNIRRFPEDFMFQLTEKEMGSLRLQFATLKKGRGHHRKYRPYVFTEHGVAMLSSVLNSSRAIQVNIQIMRVFVKLRRMMASHADLACKIEGLEKRYDGQFHVVFEAIRRLLTPPPPKKRRIGFITENRRKEVSHASR